MRESGTRWIRFRRGDPISMRVDGAKRMAEANAAAAFQSQLALPPSADFSARLAE